MTLQVRKRLNTARQVLRDDGPRGLYHRTRTFVGRRVFGRKKIVLSVGMEDVLNANWSNQPIIPGKKAGTKLPERLRVGWVIPPIGPGSGGHQNILRFARYLESKGHICTIYIYDPQKFQIQEDVDMIMSMHFPEMKAKVIVGLDGLGEKEAIFATSWQTAYPVFNCLTTAKKFYFVQDFEPFFYPIGTESVLAENTYRFGFTGITAGKWLTKKLSTEYGMTCDYYDFGSDADRYRYENSGHRKKVLFYARPVTPRRAFELGVLALEIFAQNNPDYEINMAGWDVSEYQLPFKYVNHGVLRLEDLNALYNDSAAALVISLTNMSLLPLELISAGCIPIVNTGENNTLVSSNPYINYAVPTPGALAEALSTTVNRPDLPEYARKAAASVQSLNWDDSGKKFVQILMRHLNG